MATVKLEGREIVIYPDGPGDIDVDQDALTAAIGASAAIEAWEVEAGAEMTPEKMEFAARFFVQGFRFGKAEPR